MISTKNRKGEACFLQAPLASAVDTTLHRHLCQLAATREMFVAEKDTITLLQGMGASCCVRGMLLYVDDAGVTTYDLPRWWMDRGSKIVRSL